MDELPSLGRLVRMDERLREVADDAEAVRLALAEAEQRLGAAETPELHTYAGQAARLLGDHELAIDHLSRALVLEPTPQARIRLGEAYRSADRLDDAERELRTGFAQSRGTQAEHYALQHLGKTLADAGRNAEARVALERALELRRADGDAQLVASTEAALSRLAR